MSDKKTRRHIPVEQRPSPNFNARKTPIDMIVLHYTGMSSLAEVLRKLCDPLSELSAHYVVDEKGNIYQLVHEDNRAWHAGISNWQGQRDVNSRSIGIEIMNNGQVPFTREQISAVMAICRTMMERHNIPVYNVVGHSDVAPARKVDPGPLFPWGRLMAHNIALDAEATLSDYFATATKQGDTRYIRTMLARLGYGGDYSPNPTPTLREMIAAFQARWEPLVFDQPEKVGLPTRQTLALLRAVDRAQTSAEMQHARRAAPKHPRPPTP